MKKFFKWIFFWNDWYTVWADDARWSRDGEMVEKAVYEIQYSPLRNDYRLKCSGYRPKLHNHYSKNIVKAFMQYKSRVPEWKIFSIKKKELHYN